MYIILNFWISTIITLLNCVQSLWLKVSLNVVNEAQLVRGWRTRVSETVSLQMITLDEPHVTYGTSKRLLSYNETIRPNLVPIL